MQLDHVVVVVPDLEQAIADYSALGFTVSPGGEHADGRTHNALIPFADGSYVELIAFRPGVAAPDHRWWQAAVAGGGLTDWALGLDALAARVQDLREAGLPFDEPRDGGRLRPDGVRLAWRVAEPVAGRGLPFLIEDLTVRSLRVPSGEAAIHSNGAQGVDAVVVAVPELQLAAQQFATLLGTEAPDPASDPLLAADVVTLPCGAVRIMLTSAPAGPIHAHLMRLGSGPYALFLRAERDTGDWLGLEHTGGALIRLRAAS
jgi:catechol 2,3-dioxygenase-like lactoylglutathione lyase family enzyme